MNDKVIEQTEYLTLLQEPSRMYKIIDEHGELVYTTWYLHRAIDRFNTLKEVYVKGGSSCVMDNTSQN